MADEISFRNKRTDEIKSVKNGFSWTLFLFAPVLGIPFFMRKFYPAAVAMIGWDLLVVLLPESGPIGHIVPAAGFAVSIALGLSGNQMTAKYYLKNGWELTDPDSEEAQRAMEKWALA